MNTDDVITCDAPTVVRGHPGLVTCNFNVDVSTQRPVIVSVEHYPDNNDSGVYDDTIYRHIVRSAHSLCLRDSFVFHPLTSSLLVDAPSSIKYLYSGTVYSTVSDALLP